MDDIRVSSWLELMEALYTIPKSGYGRYRSDYVYRGVANEAWKLETSLFRLGGPIVDIEKPLLRNFRKYADPGSFPSDKLWFTLAAAQHHGLPTRLLDWTTTPKVALHFATAEEKFYDRDAAIWCIDVVEVQKVLPPTLHEVLSQEYAYLFSVEMLEFIETLADFDALGKDENFVLFFEPPSFDARITNQGAIMSILSGADISLSDFLVNHSHLYHRIIIPKELKWEIRDKLDQDNVTERILFPGLDGLSRWLKRYYGLGPNKPLIP
jgi:hypothetical protein